MDTKEKVSRALSVGAMTNDSIVQSLIAEVEAARREAKYWASKGNKEMTRKAQLKYKLLNSVLGGAFIPRQVEEIA